MSLLKKTILTAAFGESGGALVLIEQGLRSARVVGEESVAESAVEVPAELVASAATALVRGRGIDEIIVVVPARWCVTREMALTPADWASAKPGVLESLEDLLPITADDAYVGVLGLYNERERCDRGVIVATRRSVVDPVLAALRRAAPNANATVVSSTMAALGLGLEQHRRAWVAEQDGVVETGVALTHGLPVSLDRLQSGDVSEQKIDDEGSLHGLAVGAALAGAAAPGAFVPLLGEKPRSWKRYVQPAMAVAAAAVLFAAAPVLWSARLDAGAEHAVAQRASLQEEFQASQNERAEAERYIGLCGDYDRATDGWQSVTPVLRDAVGSIEADGFFYRLRYEGGTLFFTGESSDPGRVLERLEDSVSLSGASQTTPLTPSPIDSDMLVFSFRATGVTR